MDANVISQIIVLFALIGIGYITNKAGIMDGTANAKFSSFILKVALPASIIKSSLGDNDFSIGTIFSVTGVAIGVFILIPLLTHFVGRGFKLDSTYKLMLNYSNLGFMGFPIIGSMFGADKVFYAAIFMMVFNVHIFTFGIMTLQGKGESPKALLKKLTSPGIISALLAFVFVIYKVSLPPTIESIIGSLGNVTAPMAMIVIGSSLAQVSVLKSLKNYRLFVVAAFKLIVYPLFVYIVFGMIIGHGLIVDIATILVGLPVAGNVTMLSSEYGGDINLAAEGTYITTVLSLITIPIMMILI